MYYARIGSMEAGYSRWVPTGMTNEIEARDYIEMFYPGRYIIELLLV